MLAATCSKIGEPSDEGTGGGPSVKIVGQNQVIQASDLAQFIPVQPGQTVGVLNPDGTVTQLNPQVVTSVSASGSSNITNIKTITSVANQNASSSLTQSILAQPTNANPGISYSIIQPQQIQIDGQEAIFIPASTFSGGQQAIQISGNQIISSPNQTVVRTQNANSASQAGQPTAYIQGIGNVSLAQLTGGQSGMPMAVTRQGNVVQTLQLPALQQTISLPVPISQANGQTIYQNIQIPIQAIQAVAAGNVQHVTAQVMPQMQQVNSIHQACSIHLYITNFLFRFKWQHQSKYHKQVM